ncbi:MAG: dihydrolipoyl dehydrogenase [Defluviitaleaceae bacterium]|nr:dihydrolipoyl dehydrogenase [Defluviitaleaceae bacterium]
MGFDYDITVLGGGPGGYVAAIRAAQEGKKVCLIERANVGGVCLNEGCIPTKTLLKSAGVYRDILHSADFGVEGVNLSGVKVSMPKLQQRRKTVIDRLVGGVKGLLKANKVTVVEASARFTDAHTVAAGDKSITSEYFIVATGSNVLIPPFIALEGKNNVLTSKEALLLEEIPKTTVIIGGGVIGIEFAYLLNTLGGKVIVIELMDNILPMVDEEVSSIARKRLEKDGVTIRTGARVKKVSDNNVFYEYDGTEHSASADAVIMAVGRVPNTEGLDAEKAGVEFNKNAIAVDELLRTNIKNIYAVGDVNGKVMLAHTASHEGIAAVENIYGGSVKVDYNKIPSCIYIEPEVSCIGMTEKQARERYGDVKVGKFPMAANGKSLTAGDTDGMVKVVVDGRLGEILGVHICGNHVTEMISEISLAMNLEATIDEIIATIHPHPTVSESIPEAFMASYGKAIHFK